MRGVNQRESKALGVVVPTVNNASQFAGRVDAVEHALVVRAAHLDHVVNRVRQVRGQDVDHHGFNSDHRFARHDGQGQLHVFLKFGVVFVNGRKRERLAVEEACRKLKIQGEHGREIVAWRRITSRDCNLHLNVVERIAHEHFHRHSAPFGNVKLGRGKSHHHGAQPATSRAVLSEEVERVLGVDVPLGCAFIPVRGTLSDVGFPNQRVFRHGAITHRPRALWVFSNDAHHVNDLAVLAKNDGVVSVEPRHRAQHLAHAHNFCRSLRVAHHVHAS